ncbi:MAG TPA: hypothetical protein VMD51_09230 [Mycobacterium sp.]|nr:hypothetical protein [Mycobacterium sp.]
MATVSIGVKRLAYVVVGAVIAIGPAVAVFAAAPSAPGPRVLACQETEVEDSFSMNCAPALIPDTSDPLTEAEVALPGFNAVPHDNPGYHGEGSDGGGGGHR